MMNTAMASGARRKITLERTFEASIAEVWDLWATKEGIESWWGPDGFVVKVQRMDLRPGGELLYTMTAVGPDQIEFLRKAGMPLASETRATYTVVDPPRRLAYTTFADFIPGVEPYDASTLVELHQSGQRVQLTLTIDAMHDENWTNLAVMGWKNELEKLAQILKGRSR
jgi:uncharacterized protein YndB with AHSA1/START domain